jgi:hypothetical protein
MPLRLAIEDKDNQLCGQILSTGEATEKQLRQQLEPALPFADYDLATEEENHSPETKSVTAHQQLQLTSLPLRIGSNLYCADSSILLPEMGASGATLLAWTLAENLASKHKQGSK